MLKRAIRRNNDDPFRHLRAAGDRGESCDFPARAGEGTGEEAGITRETGIIYLSPSFPGTKTLCTLREALTELWERGWAVICPSLLQDWLMHHHPDTRTRYALHAAQTTNESLLAGCDALFLMPGWAFCEEGHALYSLAEHYDVEVICASGEGGIALKAGMFSCHS